MHHHQGSRRDPLLDQFDRHSNRGSLHEAKLAAWALAIGEGAPAQAARGRRINRGMLPDVLPPEPPPGARRPGLLARLAGGVARLIEAWRAPAAARAQPALFSTVEIATIAYLDRTDDAEAAGETAVAPELPARAA